MSVESVISALGTDWKTFTAKLTADIAKAKAVWNIISSQQTRAILMKVGADAITVVKDTASAAESGGLNVQLDAQTVADINALIADAKTGDGVILADFKALGVVLTS